MGNDVLPEDIPEGWAIVEGRLHREFEFADFVDAFSFMTSGALVAERMGHHPDWSNSWNRVVVDLITHDKGGITDLDIELATRLGECADRR